MIGLDDILTATGGTASGVCTGGFSGVCTDSRTIKKGELFVPLSGPRFDGHDYVAAALAAGGFGSLARRGALTEVPAGACIVEVADTLKALQDIASHIRRMRAETPVIGVTGTNGKTTTKEMIASILSVRGPVLKNSGNLNNEIGLPISLARLDASHWAAVLEMGMSGPGEIARLAAIAAPDVGVITNVGAAHLEGLGSVEAVAVAKAELLDGLPEDGSAALNMDDPMLGRYIERMGKRAVTFGLGNGAMFTAESVSDTGSGVSFRLKTPEGEAMVALPVHGMHNVMNALAAAAAVWPLGLTPDETSTGLEAFRPVGMRMEFVRLGGVTVINDVYNANPASMAAALNTLAALKNCRKMAALGDMLELGALSAESHYNVGRLAGAERLALLVATGAYSEDVARGAADAGMDRRDIVTAADTDGAAAAVLDRLSEGDCLLVKGSRGMKMERVVEIIAKAVERR